MSEEGHWISGRNGNKAQRIVAESPSGDGGSIVEGCQYLASEGSCAFKAELVWP